jgi:MarR family transcriptional regulator, transcriptional regulator for hemolysin
VRSSPVDLLLYPPRSIGSYLSRMERTPPPPLSLARASFGRALVLAARDWRREADRALAEYGLSEATALPLLTLARIGGGGEGEAAGDGIRQGALAAELGIEGPSLVRLLDALEAEGLVARRCDAADRRAKTLHLTDAGRSMVARIECVLNDVRARLLHLVDERDVETALRVLHAVQEEIRRRDDVDHDSGRTA